jgi:hypothetical protein
MLDDTAGQSCLSWRSLIARPPGAISATTPISGFGAKVHDANCWQDDYGALQTKFAASSVLPVPL